jgi:hypothetical protein
MRAYTRGGWTLADWAGLDKVHFVWPQGLGLLVRSVAVSTNAETLSQPRNHLKFRILRRSFTSVSIAQREQLLRVAEHTEYSADQQRLRA